MQTKDKLFGISLRFFLVYKYISKSEPASRLNRPSWIIGFSTKNHNLSINKYNQAYRASLPRAIKTLASTNTIRHIQRLCQGPLKANHFNLTAIYRRQYRDGALFGTSYLLNVICFHEKIPLAKSWVGYMLLCTQKLLPLSSYS